MKYSNRRVIFILAWCIAVLFVAPADAKVEDETGNAYAAIMAGYREGDFGTSVNNELYSLTPEFGYVSGDYSLSASVPLQHLRTSSGGLSSTETGIGDATLLAGKLLWRDDTATYSLNGALDVKLATGDENKGLGTGGTDVGVSISGSRKYEAYVFTLLAGYTQVDEPSGVDYNNVVSYGVGVNRTIDHSNVFASLQGQTSALPGGTAPLEFDVGFFHLLSLDNVVIVHVFTGLSDGSPDGGMGVGLVRWF